jgi:DNA repair protein RecO (recombination protein O)
MNAPYSAWASMSDNVFNSQPAFILHQQPYRESSLIIDVLTRDFGRISLIAKGVRKTKSKTAGLLRPFVFLSLSFAGKSDLKTLTHVETFGLPHELTGLPLYCGFYINELVSIFLHKDDPNPEVFLEYRQCLSKLSQDSQIEAALRVFELNLMDNIGYGMSLNFDLHQEKPVALDKKYSFNKEVGLYEDVAGPFSGTTLLAMEQRKFDTPQILSETKLLMRMVIDSHLDGRPLKSRAFINSIVKRM